MGSDKLDKREWESAPLQCLRSGGRPSWRRERAGMPKKSRLTYANVVSTLALFLALSGGVAFAASKVRTDDIFQRAVTSGKLALGAVRSNQIADRAVSTQQLANGAVGTQQIANGAVGARQIAAASVAPANLQFPVYFAASPLGGSAAVPSGELVSYPLDDAKWGQGPGQLNVVFGAAAATLAYDGNGGGSCQLYFELSVNGQQTGGGQLSTESTSPERVEQSVGVQPDIDPTAPVTNELSARIGSNGSCTPASTVDSARFRVLDFG